MRKFKFAAISVDIDSDGINELYEESSGKIIEFRSTLKALGEKYGADLVEQFDKSDKIKGQIIATIISATISTGIKYVRDPNGAGTIADPIELDYYVFNGGNCVAKSLMTLAVLQRFREAGEIGGEFGFKSNFEKGKKIGHAWVGYRNGDDRMVVDSTGGIVIPFKNAKERKAVEKMIKDGDMWNYFDTSRLRRTFVKDSVVTGAITGILVQFHGSFAGVRDYIWMLGLGALFEFRDWRSYKKGVKDQTDF